MQLHIKCSNDTKVTVDCTPETTIAALKSSIEAEVASTPLGPIPADAQRLIYAGRVLKDDETVASYKMADGHTIHLVKMNKPKEAPGPSPTVPSPAVPLPEAPGNTPVTPAAGTGQTPFNMFAGMGGAGADAGGQGMPGLGGFGGMPGLGGLGGMGGLPGGMPDEATMDMLMNDPAVMQQMVYCLFSFFLSLKVLTPAIVSIQSTMMQNPQFMEMIMAANPMLANANPQMRQMMQGMFSNPGELFRWCVVSFGTVG